MKQKNNRATVWGLRPSERMTILILGDLLAGIVALFAALYFWSTGPEWLKFSWKFLQTRPDFWFYLLPIVWLLLLIDIYDVHRAARWKDTLRGVFLAAVVCLGIYLIIYFTSTPKSLPRRGVAAFITAAIFITLVWRLLYIRVFTGQPFIRKVLILGAGKAGNTLMELLKDLRPQPFEIAGWIDDDASKIGTEIFGYKVLGGNDRLLELVDELAISELIIAISGELQGSMFQAILDSQERGVVVTTMPAIYEELFGRIPIFHLESDWVLRGFGEQSRSSGFYELGKRLMDLFGSLIGIIVLILIFPFVSIAILLDTGSPIFYRQARLGKGARPYQIIKFRTMIVESEVDGKARFATENDTRVTRVGKFLRKSHLDEVPQFLNVFLGSMSLVGPRPERPQMVENLQKKIPFYRARLLVKPGIAGWAQINFGYAGTVEDTATKLEYDLYYIKKRNLIMDLAIILRTIGSVVGLKGQ